MEKNNNKPFFYALPIACVAVFILSPDAVFLVREDTLWELIVNVLFLVSFLLLPTVLFYRRLIIYYTLISLYCGLVPVLFLPLLIVREKISPEIIQSTFSSNLGEIKELLGWNTIVLLLLMAGSFAIAFRVTRSLPRKMPFKKALAISAASAAMIVLIVLVDGNRALPFTDNGKIELQKNYPFGVAVETYSVMKVEHLENNYAVETKNFRFGAYKTGDSSERRIVLLVIGESSRYDHWAINGYGRNTSPFLDTTENIVSFSDVSPGATITYKSVPFLITRAPVDDYLSHLREKSVLEAFHEAGFYTVWISNQAPEANSASEFHTADADTVVYTNHLTGTDAGFLREGLYDGLTVPMFENILMKNNSDLFVVVHTMGCHWRYDYRYPASFNVFTPVAESKGTDNEALVDSYDNTIVYTDYLLHAFIDELRSTGANASLLYVSDHGENLEDDSSGLKYHSPVPNRYTAHVPLFIWYSDAFKRTRQDAVKAVHGNLDKPVSTVRTAFYTMLDLGGIRIKDDSGFIRYSLCSQNLENSEQRISGGSNEIYYFANLNKSP